MKVKEIVVDLQLSQGLRVDDTEKFYQYWSEYYENSIGLGATGFIGGQIAQAAFEAGWRVSGYRRDPGHTGQLDGYHARLKRQFEIRWPGSGRMETFNLVRISPN
jgi:hypothetical protein